MKGSDGLQVVPIVGVAGMGKTALARRLLEEPLIDNHFDAIGWVRLSVKYNKHDKLLDLLASMKKLRVGALEDENDELFVYQYNWSNEINQMSDKQLAKHVYNILKHKRYIILVDDVCDVADWNDLKELFPDYHNRNRILLTTRDVEVAPARPHLLDHLSDEDALALLEDILFRGKQCPEHLISLEKDIALSCRGFPHAVVIVGKLLSCAKPTAEYWEIASSSINKRNNYGDIMDALVSLTYNHLPRRLKVCLLYMAIFPYNYTVPMIKFLNLMLVEGFEEVTASRNMRSIAADCCMELSMRGFIVLSMNAGDHLSVGLRIAEEAFHHFLVSKAQEEKFFLVIKKGTSHTFRCKDTTFNQRRMCIQQNIVRFIKDLSLCNLNSDIRSLIYSGPEPQYRLVAWANLFKLLEVLEALKIGFYTFPPEILELAQLKFLALSYNGLLPAAVCSLQNLQVWIVSDYLNLKCSEDPSYAEIWNLKDLMHLEVVGSDLPELPPSGANLEKLFQLSGVSDRSCTRNVFERTANLEILEVRIESSSPEVKTLGFFSYINVLQKLRIFKCQVM